MTQPEVIDGESRAVESYREAGAVGRRIELPLIDIEAEKIRLDNFREFVKTVLDPEKGHYGKAPGIDRDFLKQPGAEIIYRALQCRPRYRTEVSEVDRDHKYCYFIVHCEVVHSESGMVVGEANGAATSDEYQTYCQFKVPKTRDGLVTCPEHGTGTGRTWDRGESTKCEGKTAQGLERTLQNTLAKANKRAMVGAIRTVACVSELFSQDEDLMGEDNRQKGDDGQGAAKKPRNQPQRASAKTANEAQVAELRAAMTEVKKAGVTLDDILAFSQDEGLLPADANVADVKSLVITRWMAKQKPPGTPAAWAAAVIKRFAQAHGDEEPEPEAGGEATAENPVEEVDDDIPF